MTDNEIIKALECCIAKHCNVYEQTPCLKCPIKKLCCFGDLLTNALDLINRQKAEIERWKEKARAAFLINLNEEAKAEAVAFLIEKLIDMSVCKDNGDGTESLYVSVSNARQFLKEMVGEE